MASSSNYNRQCPSLEEIFQILRRHMPELSRRYKVKTLGIFGSHLRGEAREDSDLDILVELEEKSLTLLQFIALENYLSNILGVRVDLVEKSTLKPAIGRHILAEVQQV